MTQPIRILLIDDHAIVRKGIGALLATEPGINVVGEGTNGIEAVQKPEELRPDVIQRVANHRHGNARWLCQCDCGGQVTVQGIRLRADEKKGRTPSCPACRPKRPGTVQRRER